MGSFNLYPTGQSGLYQEHSKLIKQAAPL